MEKTILVTRKINCSELSMEQFVELMGNDLKIAYEEYVRIFKPIDEARYNLNVERNKIAVELKAREYATKKWKTDKKRDAYVAKEVAKIKVEPFKFYPVSFFDFEVEPWKNGISECCILHPFETVERLKQCFEYIKDNEYFKSAKGWQLIDVRNFRPEIKLILDEEMENKYHNAERKLSESIFEFYKNTNYCGD